jgi:DNA-binding XRE family transcriptional regulator
LCLSHQIFLPELVSEAELFELANAEVVNAILEGKNPIKVWREYRNLTQQQLADLIGISKPYLSQLETGKRTGTTHVLSVIAKALDVSLEQIANISKE